MKNLATTSLSISLFSVLIILSMPCFATFQIDSVASKLFDDTEPIVIVLQMDINKVFDDKSDDPKYNKAVLIQKIENNKIKAFNIKIKPRGKTRRKESICEFPPLKINFKKESTANTLFAGQDKIKMVTHCQDFEAFENFINLEYLLYKAYNQVTDKSYRVRLVQVTYQDTKQNNADMVNSGFLIEDEDQMATRIEGQVSDKKIWSSDSCNRQAVNIFVLFQFMIGNTDWWIHTRHNVDLVQTKQGLIPVPFDFDYSGIINTPYATPAVNLPINEVKDRFLKNYCHEASDYEEAIALFNQQKSAIVSVFEDAVYLDKRYKKSALKYIDDFYKIINDEQLFGNYLDESCAFVKKIPNKAPDK